MRCVTATKYSSSYLDGDLNVDLTSAIRGHLRTCEACERCFEEEAALVNAAAQLSLLDPPDHLWQEIVSEIAKAEVADSNEGAASRWFRRTWRFHLIGAAGLCAAIAILVLRSPEGEIPAKTVATEEQRSAPSAHRQAQAQGESLQERRLLSIEVADRDYLETISELRIILEEDRADWSVEQAKLVDAELAKFKRIGIGTRLAIASGRADTRSRDELYRHYQREISFLQSALARELAAGVNR